LIDKLSQNLRIVCRSSSLSQFGGCVNENCFVVAIDGDAGSGKNTAAKRLAGDLGLSYLDSGLIYRRVTLALIEAGGKVDDVDDVLRAAKGIDLERLTDPRLHSEEVNELVPKVSKLKPLRDEVLDLQRNFPAPPGTVIDGRDIGSVVFPTANVKFFLTARPEVAAARILTRLQDNGESGDYDKILNNLLVRNKEDSERVHSPLVRAPDAHKIETSDITKDQVYMEILRICAKRLRESAFPGLD
jgi:CMP/dCMP kinase